VESLIAPIVVFRELNAAGQLGAVVQPALDRRSVASMSIQGAYKLQVPGRKVINRKGPQLMLGPFY
ncbi:MAG: hypothetical protein RIS19_551, partial [Actinomycetota bacterium]